MQQPIQPALLRLMNLQRLHKFAIRQHLYLHLRLFLQPLLVLILLYSRGRQFLPVPGLCYMCVFFKINAVNISAYAGHYRADIAINLRIISINMFAIINIFFYPENNTYYKYAYPI